MGYTVSRMAGLQERQARTNSIEVPNAFLLRRGVSACVASAVYDVPAEFLHIKRFPSEPA